MKGMFGERGNIATNIEIENEEIKPLAPMTYLNSYTSVEDVINLWFDEENKLMLLP